MDDELFFLYMFWQFPGFGFARMKRIREMWGSFIQAQDCINWEQWQSVGIGRPMFDRWLVYRRENAVLLREELNLLLSRGIKIVSYWQDDYPVLLREIYSPPPIFFYRGNLKILTHKCIAVVGTRRVTEYGRKVVKNIVQRLVGAGWAVVSGMAFGIDSLAHDWALRSGGLTVAVVGGSLDQVYPRSNNKLARLIVSQNGLLISEHAWNVEAEPWHFPSRNRIVSGLSRTVLVVEAPQESGAKITARLALEQNRQVLAVPGDIFSPNSFGCNELIKEGATPVISIDDILLELGEKTKEQKVYEPANAGEKEILELLQVESKCLDELLSTGKRISDILIVLNTLQLKGVVRENSGKWELSE